MIHFVTRLVKCTELSDRPVYNNRGERFFLVLELPKVLRGQTQRQVTVSFLLLLQKTRGKIKRNLMLYILESNVRQEKTSFSLLHVGSYLYGVTIDLEFLYILNWGREVCLFNHN